MHCSVSACTPVVGDCLVHLQRVGSKVSHCKGGGDRSEEAEQVASNYRDSPLHKQRDPSEEPLASHSPSSEYARQVI